MNVKWLILIIVCILPITAEANDDISIDASLSSDAVGLGGSVTLTVTVNGPQDLPKPQMPNLSMFEVFTQGTSTNISIVNGQMASSVTYSYVLMPQREGTFVIKPVVLVHNQKRYTTDEMTLKVVASGAPVPQSGEQSSSGDQEENRDVFMTAEVNKKSAFVNQQITLSMKFYNAVRLYSQPDYTPPQTTDFWTDVIPPQKTYTVKIGNRNYNVIEIQTALFPTRSGELSIGAGMITVSVPSQRRRRRNDPFSAFDGFFQRGESVTIRSNPLTVNVKPLPVENKPDDFSGTVGRFKISSSADKTTVDVNQPVTVTYKINGTGNIKTIAEPVFEENRDFRIYKSSSDEKISKISGVLGGTKIFEEVFIPKRAGKLTIPSAKLNYFDPVNKKYKDLTTRPIELTVSASTGEEYEDIPYRPIAGRVVDTKAKDILYIKSNSDDLAQKQSLIIFRPFYMVLNGLPVLLLAFVLINRRWKDKLAGDIGYARSRVAKRMARKRLASARKMAKPESAEKFYSEIRTAVFSYVADKLNISPHGLTNDKVRDIIEESGAGEEIAKNMKDLLRRADFAQYSSSGVSQEQIDFSLQMAEQVMVELEGIEIA